VPWWEQVAATGFPRKWGEEQEQVAAVSIGDGFGDLFLPLLLIGLNPFGDGLVDPTFS